LLTLVNAVTAMVEVETANSLAPPRSLHPADFLLLGDLRVLCASKAERAHGLPAILCQCLDQTQICPEFLWLADFDPPEAR
jgi:hypothetical protein